MTERRGSASRHAAVVTVAILLSRLVGLVRQRVVAHFFGTSAVADAVAAAFRIGNLAQNLLGEGALSATFIPVYARLRGFGDEKAARSFARRALGALLVATLCITALGVVSAPLLARVLAAGFHGEKLALTVEQVRLLFPMTGLLVLSAWALGVLNSHREFFLPYAAPVIWSLAQIAAVLLGARFGFVDGALARVLALGALIGAAAVATVLFRRAKRHTGSIRPSFDFRDSTVREAASRFPNVLLGRGVIQISGLLDTLIVSFLGDSAVSAFNYAQTIYLLPMSVLGTGEAAAALPELSTETSITDVEDRNAKLRHRLSASLTRVTVLAIPAAVVMALLPSELVALLFRSGRFDEASTQRVAAAVAVYSFALLGNASSRVLATAHFALGNTRTPARMALVRVVVSTVLALLLLDRFGMVGVVMGASVAAWFEASLLGWSVRRELGGLDLSNAPWLRLAGLAAITAAVAIGMRRGLGSATGTAFGALCSLTATAAAFALAAWRLKLVDLRKMLGRSRKAG